MIAISRFSLPLLVALALLCSVVPANAQIPTTRPYASLFLIRGVEAVDSQRPESVAAVLNPPTDPLAAAATTPPPAIQRAPRGVLTSLYAGFGTLQALDTHSTLRAIDAGYVEQNPLMRWTISHPAALISMKAMATAGTIFFAERIRKKHPKRAVAFIAAINAAYALIVVHNYKAPLN